MSALTATCSQGASACSSRLRVSSSRSRTLKVCAANWTQKEKGWDRPWIQANSQPIMAPRTADMAGDPFGLLLRQRTVFLGGEVEDFGADAIVSQLLLLDNQDAQKDIKLFINSPGGSVSAGMGIYDAMMLCRADVSTYCFGLAASMGAFLLGAGRRGKRHSMPNSRIMIHQPLGGASGQAVDIEIQAKEIMYHKANLNRIMADYTGQPLAKIEEDTDRDRYMSPLEAKEYGIIDHIIGGEEAVIQVKGSNKRFPRTRDSYMQDTSDLAKRSVMDGDPFLPGASNSWRFARDEVEPYMKSQRPGLPWFKVKKVSRQEYQEMVEKRKAVRAAEVEKERAALPAEAGEGEEKRKSPKEKMDQAWDDAGM